MSNIEDFIRTQAVFKCRDVKYWGVGMNASSLGSVWGSYIRLRVIVVLRTCSNRQ